MPKARTKRVDCEEKGAGCHGCCIGCAVGNGLSCRRLCRRRRGNRLHFRQDDRGGGATTGGRGDRKSTRLNSSHSQISYAVFCLKKKKEHMAMRDRTPQLPHPPTPLILELESVP